MPLSVTVFVQNEEIRAGIPVPAGLCCQTWARRLGRAGSLGPGHPQNPRRAGVRDGVLASEQPRDQAGDPAWASPQVEFGGNGREILPLSAGAANTSRFCTFYPFSHRLHLSHFVSFVNIVIKYYLKL